MNILSHIATLHPKSVASVFQQYNIKAKPTGRALSIALLKHRNTNFFNDLNAALTAANGGVSFFDDDAQYYIADQDDDNFDDNFDGDTTIYEYMDKKSGRKKKVKKAKKPKKRTLSTAIKNSGTPEILDNTGDDEPGGRTIQDKIKIATDTVGSLATFGGSLASSIIAAKGGRSSTAADSLESGTDEAPGTPGGNFFADNKVYIIATVLFLAAAGAIVFILKRKKSK